MSSPYSKRKRYALDVEAWVQFKLLRLAAFHPETTKADVAALAEIIQRYWGKHGNGFVSDEEICALTGLTERTVRRARKNLACLGFVTVVRAGGRGHATVYTPNFSMVRQKEDISVLDKKADIPVLLTDENVRLKGELPDTDVRPSYLCSGLQTGTPIDRHDSAAPTAPDGVAPLGGAPPESAQEGLDALLAAYSPTDTSKPARAAYKRAWQAIHADTDLAGVIDAAANWHQSWAQQNNPDAPRMGLVRWLTDEMYLKPAPKGYQPKERPAKVKLPTPTKPNPRKPSTPVTARITSSVLVEEGGNAELRLLLTDSNGAEHPRVLVLQHDDESVQSEGQRVFANFVHAAGLSEVEDSAEFLGRSVVLTGDGFAAPSTRPDDEPPLPVKPEPVRYANPPPSAPMTEAETAAVRAKIAALPPLAPHLNEWQRLKEEQWRRDADRREWDAAHPEFFQDEDNDEGWPAYLDAEPDDEAA